MNKNFNFIHCADLHVGSPFKGIKDVDEGLYIKLLASTYEAFDNLIRLSIEKKADFVLVAGDLLDTKDQNLRPLSHIHNGFKKLKEHGIKVFLIHGNHDPYDRISRAWKFPENCTVFSPKNTKWKRIKLPSGQEIAIFGKSFKEEKEFGNLVKSVPVFEEDLFKIALLHVTVGSPEGHIPYAPCNISDFDHRADYWALGHIHIPRIISKEPYIVYPGNIQGRHFKESGERGCYFVSIEDGLIKAEFLSTSKIVWSEIEIDLFDITNTQELLSKIFKSIEDEQKRYKGKDLLIRLLLKGQSTLAGMLLRDEKLQELHETVKEEMENQEPLVYVVEIRNFTTPKADLSNRMEVKDLPGYCLREAESIKRALEHLRGHDDIKELFKRPELSSIVPDDHELLEMVERAKYLLLELLEERDLEN